MSTTVPIAVPIADLPTPALVIDRSRLRDNLATMAARLPGARLRPHVKAHKCTSLAREQVSAGHLGFTCATAREALGLAAAGLGEDILVANEILDPARLRRLAEACAAGAHITVAVDSAETVRAAATAGLREVLIDVAVGLPRCGAPPEDAPRIADMARASGLEVRGVMGYEGHLMMVADRSERTAKVHEAMATLLGAHERIGGDIVSAGGTGTHDLLEGTGVTEVQAGSYALMDSHYATLGLPFTQAVWVVGTVISRSDKWAVADVGLKSLGMDHGDPSIDGARVWFCSDEHITFSVDDGPLPDIGARVRVVPAHVDPTVALHETAHVTDDGYTIVDRWAIDLRGW